MDMLQIKLDTEKELLNLDKELSSLRTQRGQGSSQLPREWFFVRWLRPVIPLTQEVITGQIGQAVDSMRQELDSRIGQIQTLLTNVDTHLTQLDTQLQTLTERSERHGEALDTLHEQLSSLATVTTTVAPRLDTLDSEVSTLAERMNMRSVQVPLDSRAEGVHLDTSHGQASKRQGKSSRKVTNCQVSNGQQQRSRQTIKLDTFHEEGDSVPEERGSIEERILTAQQTLGPGASNRQIARLVNCSPTTVARWLSQRENALQEQEPA